jgi:ribonuclease R
VSDRYVELIIDQLAELGDQSVTQQDLMLRLNITAKDTADFEAAIQWLTENGRLQRDRSGAISLPAMGSRVTGRYHQTARGFGFVVPDDPNAHGDLFIPPGDQGDAVTGDYVVAKVMSRPRMDQRGGKRLYGKVLEVVQRAIRQCVGTLNYEHGQWIIQPDGNLVRGLVVVRDPGAKNAAIGDKVVVELVKFPTPPTPGEGIITKVLGPKGEPEVELQSVIHQFDLPLEFPAEVVDQARQAAQGFDPKSDPSRTDLSAMTILTIDPDDARDFDDAISVRALDDRYEEDMPPGAAYELGVHIADVSTFVHAEGILDMEARKRGNSTYFPRYVIPMLPEILSNGVCSLQEKQPRFTKTAFIYYDNHGKVVGSRFANTIIYSCKRLTYKQAQAVIDDARGEGKPYSKGLLECPPNPNVPNVESRVRDLLVTMDRLARLIRQRRIHDGMLELNMPEVELVLDDNGKVIDAHPEDDSFTHKIIEMFMVEANEAVSRYLTRMNLPVMRRVHPDPAPQTSDNLRQLVTMLGRKVPKVIKREDLQQLLDWVRGKPIAQLVSLAVLKTMTTAEYSPLDLGHYALASDNYAHFTSPIRRYADLVVHRALDSVLRGQPKMQGKPKRPPRGEPAAKTALGDLMPAYLGNVPDFAVLVKLGKHLSITERRSSMAESEIRAVKVLSYLADHVGDIIDGVVTGVNGFAVFVQSTHFLAEGMIRIADLPSDTWQFEEGMGMLRGQRSGRRIAMGDRVKVQIVSVNIPGRQLAFRLLEHASVLGGDVQMHRFEPAHTPKQVRKEPDLNAEFSPRGRKNQVKREIRGQHRQDRKPQNNKGPKPQRGRGRGRGRR